MFDQELSDLLKKAMINKDETAKNILRLLKGEIQKEQNKPKNISVELPEAVKYAVVKRLIKSNATTANYIKDSEKDKERFNILSEENKILEALLPKTQ